MQPFHAAVLALCAVLFNPAVAQSIRWNPVPTTLPPVQVYVQPPATIDFSGLASALDRYGAARERSNSEPIPSNVFRQRNADGSMSVCSTYGENTFCKPDVVTSQKCVTVGGETYCK